TDRYNNVEEYDSHGKLIKIKKITFYPDQKTINFIEEYNPEGKLIKKIIEIDDEWLEYDAVNEKEMKCKDPNISIEEFDDNEEKFKYPPKTNYQDDGKTIKKIYEYNQNTGMIQKAIHFYDDGKTIICIDEYSPDQLIKETYYNQDGTIKKVINY
ncbi:MAG: DUF2963 domain-containing protein, partial [Candidatus Phytoplasma australiense]|nr:DUF2963 domain-containing protein [Candidatus Phytoplasma australiense]